MVGIADSVAEQQAGENNESVVQSPQQAYQQSRWRDPNQGGQKASGIRGHDSPSPVNPYGSHTTEGSSHSSLSILNSAAAPPGIATPGNRTPSRVSHGLANDPYTDDPHQFYSRPQPPGFGYVNPQEIEDDGDDGLHYAPRSHRTSMLSLSSYRGSSHRGRDGATAGPAAGGALGGLVVAKSAGSLSGAKYSPVVGSNMAYEGADAMRTSDPSSTGPREKSPWRYSASIQTSRPDSRKCRLIIILLVGLIIAAAIVVGIVFGVVLKDDHTSGTGSDSSAAQDTNQNGDLNINSKEIQALLNNKNLHKVFPGVDYTPLNVQYPECLHAKPSQNNITRDLAVLSQLTNTIRLYGTDCNQTEMLIHAVKQLKMQDIVKIWLGVWQDNNSTTNERQLSQLWNILDNYDVKYFKGVIVANEIIFRKQMSAAQLASLLNEVRNNMTAKGISLPVATSDLSDSWQQNPILGKASDYIMANIHPFFAGTNAKIGSAWTYAFWSNILGGVFKADRSKNIISETGWPTQGGTDCGAGSTETDCPNAAVAGIAELNQFMGDFVCSALANATEFFWFEAFDEPWKISFNEKSKEWEDQWGLMDVNRKLKNGVKIPDCGGKTVR